LDAGLEAKICSTCATKPQIYCQFLLVSQHCFTGSIRLVERCDAEIDGDDDDDDNDEKEEEEEEEKKKNKNAYEIKWLWRTLRHFRLLPWR